MSFTRHCTSTDPIHRLPKSQARRFSEPPARPAAPRTPPAPPPAPPAPLPSGFKLGQLTARLEAAEATIEQLQTTLKHERAQFGKPGGRIDTAAAFALAQRTLQDLADSQQQMAIAALASHASDNQLLDALRALAAQKPKPVKKTVKRDKDGRITEVLEVPQ